MTTQGQSPTRPLEDIRAELDGIDERIFALVTERAALAEEVRKAKSDTGVAALRPSREASMLRRLAARPRGAMQLEQIWRLWRELIMANSRLQFPFTVDTVAASRDLALWDMGRSHFCFETPMIAHDTAPLALDAAKAERTHVALLPAADESWWQSLVAAPGSMRVFAALPMIAEGDEATPHALGLGDVTLEPTDKDISVFHVPLPAAGETAVRAALEAAGHTIMYWINGQGRALVGINGFLSGAGDAPRPFTGLMAGIEAVLIGAHAAPIVLDNPQKQGAGA